MPARALPLNIYVSCFKSYVSFSFHMNTDSIYRLMFIRGQNLVRGRTCGFSSVVHCSRKVEEDTCKYGRQARLGLAVSKLLGISKFMCFLI